MTLYGSFAYDQLLENVGDIRQFAGYQRLMLMEGRGKGNEIIQVRNGSGLQFQVNVSRGFDIGLCELHGIPISWMSHTGPVAPAFYEKDGTEWGRGFEGGLLATCGLSNIGKPSEDHGESFGQHGRISYIPAELLQTEGGWKHGTYCIQLRGKVREVKALCEHLVLERKITTRLGENRIDIQDKITNESFEAAPYMVMYHFNFGFPIIGEHCRIHLPGSTKRWIHGEGPTVDSDRFPPPTKNAQRTVMLHEDLEDENGIVQLSVSNDIHYGGRRKRLQATLNYRKEACPYLTQWKNPASGIYVLGLEPGNATTEGRGVHRERGTLPILQPGECKTYELSIEFELREEQG